MAVGDDSLLVAQSEPVTDENGEEHRVGDNVVTLDFNATVAAGEIDRTTLWKLIEAAEKRLGQWR